MNQNNQSVLQKNSSERMARVYLILFAASAVLTVIGMMLTNGRSFTDTLYYSRYGVTDAFMDFYNSIRDAGTREVYKKGIIYPPLANLFFFFLSKLIDPALVAAPFKERFLMQSDMVCQMLLFGFLFVSLALTIHLMRQKAGELLPDGLAWVLALALALAYPMLYCIQRGNLVLLSLALTMFFVFYRSDERKWVGELSLIALAVAAGFKLYPALLGLLLVRDKDYKRALRLLAYGFAFTVLPFFFYDGFESMKDLAVNLQTFSEAKRITPVFVTTDVLAAYAEMVLHLDFHIMHWLLFLPMMAAAAVTVFLCEEEWKRVFCLVYLFMNLNSSGQTYILIFLLIPFVLFLLQKEHEKTDWLYLLLFAVLLIIVPNLYYRFLNPDGVLLLNERKFLVRPNQLLAAPALQAMMLLIAVQTLFGRFVKKKNANRA